MFCRINQQTCKCLGFSLWDLKRLLTQRLLLVIPLFRISIFSWISLCSVYLSRNMSITSRLHYLLTLQFIIFPYTPLYFCKVDSNVLTFISDFSNLTFLSFFPTLVSLPKGLSISLIFWKNQLWFDFLYCFSFSSLFLL